MSFVSILEVIRAVRAKATLAMSSSRRFLKNTCGTSILEVLRGTRAEATRENTCGTSTLEVLRATGAEATRTVLYSLRSNVTRRGILGQYYMTRAAFYIQPLELTHPRRFYRKKAIDNHQPLQPIVYELRLDLDQNATKVIVHGLWIGIIDHRGNLVFLDNENPTRLDFDRSRKVLKGTHFVVQSVMRYIWESTSHLGNKRFWSMQFVKHSLVSKGNYNDHYFENVVEAAVPFIGGSKDILTFLKRYESGKMYPGHQFKADVETYFGFGVRVLCNTGNVLSGFGILFAEDMTTFLDHPMKFEGDIDLIIRR